MMTSIERRACPRFRFELPVSLVDIHGARQLQAVTSNISRTGVFVYTREQLPKDSVVRFQMVMPPEVMMGEVRRITGRATVIRVHPGETGVGVAMRIDTDIPL